jgi:hypothetical protein
MRWGRRPFGAAGRSARARRGGALTSVGVGAGRRLDQALQGDVVHALPHRVAAGVEVAGQLEQRGTGAVG